LARGAGRTTMTQRIGIALSGGADSALAASLLLAGGHRVFGLHLLLAHTPEAETQAAHARDLARLLRVDFELIDAVEVFAGSVISPFCAEYAAGRTPNPCVICNRDIKFGLLLRAARERGADLLATGHYARVAPRGSGFALRRAVDHQADQSYFLYAVESSALKHLVLPLGEMHRADVRSLALNHGLVRGKSSQDICFIGGRDYRDYVARYVQATPGDLVDTDGRVLGRHRGLPFFTVGQRHRLGVALGAPAYVIRLDADSNTVVLGPAALLTSQAAILHRVTWQAPPESAHFRTEALVRYRARRTSAHVRLTGNGAYVRFTEPQRAVAPGQSVVFYDGDTVIGGGVVAETFACAVDEH
jgi:tRNA-uridine 2-sulfurtransferase